MQITRFIFRIRRKLLLITAPLLSDEFFLKQMFKLCIGHPLNLNSPRTFNEKLQWLKLYNRRPEYTQMVDKVEAKKYAAAIIGEEHIIPTLAVYDRVEDIDFEALPNKFVLKCNHNSGLGMYVCKDKNSMDEALVKKNLHKGLKEDYYTYSREWPYKNVKRRIIAEKYMEDAALHELRDYKFFCFNGKVKVFKIDFDRHIEHRANYYDTGGNLLPFGELICMPEPDRQIEIPGSLPKMISLAEKLADGCPFMRVDFYECCGKVYFGEITFFPASGTGQFVPEEWDYKLGEWLALPEKVHNNL